MTDKERTERIVVLKGKLGARSGQPGYKQNCEAIMAEIIALEKLNGQSS